MDSVFLAKYNWNIQGYFDYVLCGLKPLNYSLKKGYVSKPASRPIF